MVCKKGGWRAGAERWKVWEEERIGGEVRWHLRWAEAGVCV